MTLPRLGWVGKNPFDKNGFYPVTPGFAIKPCGGGLWASPFINDTETAWIPRVRQLVAEYYWFNKWLTAPIYEIVVSPDAHIFTLDTEEDANYLERVYKLDWSLIAQDFDAVYVTSIGLQVMFAGNWDVPTVLFLNVNSFTVGEAV